MTDRELMQMADRIEVLAFEMKAPNAYTPQFVMLAYEIREALRARLAQPEPAPVAWRNKNPKGCWQYRNLPILTDGQPLYTTPPQREWQGLTDEEVENFVQAVWPREAVPADYVRAIEAKLKEKNI